MFIVPLWVGIGAAYPHHAPPVSAVFPVLLFAVAVVGFFLLRYPLMLVIKARAQTVRRDAIRWSVIYGVITIVSGGILLLFSRQWLLIPIGAFGLVSLFVYLGFAWKREEMSTLGEWAGIAGLSLGAPGGYLMVSGNLDNTAMILYLLNVLYFGGTVSYVKFKVREQPRMNHAATWSSRLWAGRVTISYHALAIAIVVLLAFFGWMPALAAIAFVPTLCKVVGGAITRPTRPNFLRLGLIEAGFATAFGVFVIAAFR